MSEQPGNGYTRVPLRRSVTFPTVEGSWDALRFFEARLPDPPDLTRPMYAVVYDASPYRSALDYIRASNCWPKPYSTVLWSGVLP